MKILMFNIFELRLRKPTDTMELLIDLENKNRIPTNVEKSWSIEITRPFLNGRKNPIANFLRRHVHINKDINICIENVVPDNRLVFNDVDKLLSIVYSGSKAKAKNDKVIFEKKDMPIRVSFTDYSIPFQIYVDQSQIIDCTEPQNGDDMVYPITFDVVLRDPKSNECIIDPVPGAIDIKFRGIQITPQIILDADGEIQYTADLKSPLEFGTLQIVIPNKLGRIPSIDVDVVLELYSETENQPTDNDGLNNANRQDNLQLVKDVLILREKGTEIKHINEKELRCRIDDNNGQVIATKEYTLYFDMTKVQNPIKPTRKYTIKAKAGYRYSYQKNMPFLPIRVEEVSFDLLKDPQETELWGEIFREWPVEGENGVEKRIISYIPTNKEVNLPLVNFNSASLTSPVFVCLYNKATAPRPKAGVVIKRLKCEAKYIDEGDIIVSSRDGQRLSADNIVALDEVDDINIQTQEGHFLANGDNSFVKFSVSFHPERIHDIFGIKGYAFKILTSIEFDFIEDKFGTGKVASKPCTISLLWNFYRKENPDWLCVDYGSSAIVCYSCMKDYNINREIGYIHLNDIKKEAYNNVEVSEKGKFDCAKEVENSSDLLPSEIVFHDIDENTQSTTLCSQIPTDTVLPPYNKMSLILSPTKQLLKDDYHRQVPCLKLLMGNEMLPENDHYRTYLYKLMVNDEPTKVKGMHEKNDAEDIIINDYLLRIDNIFTEAYCTLFRYFVNKADVMTNTNQMVLTYPNTYTPRHREKLETIVKKVFGDTIRNVEFVSESDAVAYYYMEHWDEYHVNGDVYKNENILVYDMGAGTLDVTLLTKKSDSKSQTHLLEIMGNIGTGKAGNYLDYIIAKILLDYLELNKEKEGYKDLLRKVKGATSTNKGAGGTEERVELKEVIKNDIKPGLNRPADVDDITFKFDDTEYIISKSYILTHNLFEKFLADVTSDLVERLKASIGNRNFHIDTVIMSGRSLRLEILQKKIKSYFGDLDYIMLDKVISGPYATQRTDRSKTAVVEGAKIYAQKFNREKSQVQIRSRRLNASYGVAYKVTGTKWDYAELMSKTEMLYKESINRSFSRKNGPRTIDTNGIGEMFFVQTYLSEEDTKKSLNNNNFEFITIVNSVDLSEYSEEVSLAFDVIVNSNDNISLKVNGHPTKVFAPQGVNLRDEIIKSSLWPINIEG